MNTAIVTMKGQIVIPSKIRRKHHIKKGTKLNIVDREDQIILQPLTSEYFEKMAGILKTKGKLTKAILKERSNEREIEDEKWSK